MSYNSRIDRLDKNYLINGGFDFYQRAGATSDLQGDGTLNKIWIKWSDKNI